MRLALHYERMLPEELAVVLKKAPAAYWPIGPLEWHGEHLPFGTDPLRAQAVLERVWKKVGGALMPMLFLGTDGHKRIAGQERWGMEMFTRCFLPGSLYIRENTFKNLISEMLEFLERQGFRLAVLFTGHEAPNQMRLLERFERDRKGKRLKALAWSRARCEMPGKLRLEEIHAGPGEACEMMSVHGHLARLERGGRAPRDIRVGLTGERLAKVNRALGRARLDFQAKVLERVVRKLL